MNLRTYFKNWNWVDYPILIFSILVIIWGNIDLLFFCLAFITLIMTLRRFSIPIRVATKKTKTGEIQDSTLLRVAFSIAFVIVIGFSTLLFSPVSFFLLFLYYIICIDSSRKKN